MVYPQNFEQKIGFDNIRLKIQERCVTASAREKADRMFMITDDQILHSLLSRTAQMHLILQLDSSFPEVKYIDVIPFLAKLQVAGYYLDESEFSLLLQCLDSATQLLSYFERVQELEGKPIDAFNQDLSGLQVLPDRKSVV